MGDSARATEARDRILAAAGRCLVADGAAALTMQDVASSAGLSKGLIHYHFHDKAALLEQLAGTLGDALVRRERVALDAVSPAQAVDAMWRWLQAELARGEITALLELARDPHPGVRAATTLVAARRRETAAETITRLFAALSLTPRVPAGMLAGVAVAFMDGLALHASAAPDADHRVAFDVFWLALLSLAE